MKNKRLKLKKEVKKILLLMLLILLYNILGKYGYLAQVNGIYTTFLIMGYILLVFGLMFVIFD